MVDYQAIRARQRVEDNVYTIVDLDCDRQGYCDMSDDALADEVWAEDPAYVKEAVVNLSRQGQIIVEIKGGGRKIWTDSKWMEEHL